MEELLKQLDRSDIRVKTKNKVPHILDWVNYTEKQSIQELLKENEEYGLRTKTFRGIHVYCLVGGKEPPRNSMLFYQDKRIGDFLSKGKQVIGVGSKHVRGITYDLVKNGKWFMKLESMEELKEKLSDYGIELR